MRATVTSSQANTVTLNVEVEDVELERAIDATAKKLAQQVTIKGFRKGKVPRSVLVAHLGGTGVLRAEALRDAVPDFYAQAVSETLIDPIAQPDITITAGEEEGPVTFTVSVEVRPEITVDGYKNLRVTIPSPVVTDDDVEAQVNRFRETDAELKEVDRPIVRGDLVAMDLTVVRPGGEAPLEMADYMYTVGTPTITEGVDDLIVGMKAGETLTLDGPISPNETGTFTMVLKQVQERVLPELTDEWVGENTEWTSVDEMREEILKQLRRMRVMEAQMSRRDATLVALGDLASAAEIPEALVADETNQRLHDLGHRLAQQNMTLEGFLQATGQGPEELLGALREDATRMVRIDLALRSVIREEGLDASEEEIEAELAKSSLQMGMTSEALRQSLYENGRWAGFRSEVAKIKANTWLYEHAMYVDPQGVEVDRAILEEDQSQDLSV